MPTFSPVKINQPFFEKSIYLGIENARLMPSTKKQYKRVVDNALKVGVDLFDAQHVRQHMETISWAAANYLKSTILLGLDELETRIQETVTPDTLAQTQAVQNRFAAMRKRLELPEKPETGETVGIWLTQVQTRQLGNVIDTTILKGQRDKIAFSLLLLAGLRRSEAVSLTCKDVQQRGDRTVLIVKGKGNKKRIVPISDDFRNELNTWCELVGNGLILRSITKGGVLGDSMSAKGVYKLVAGYGRRIDMNDLRPHDLRRTFARLGYEAGIDIVQISTLLGHGSVKTTQIYIGSELSLATTVSDIISF